ncbi:core histone h2A/H2B/H3/H4 domain-containing protein [Ditylenchus destructor]|uniref:Core histone h2A/H2B/H3/H4 domain-containing protein n=1 Tax=Ditylenchus destructor TaxID=166010 RepID=A0AAD4N277_9BILA|nr:core histone h2A/H2B/H3/H4 domain-containing protein [Ditylenchus destructor]
MSLKLKMKKEKTKPVTKKIENPDSIPNSKDANFSKALYRIHKRVHPDLAISSKAITGMNTIVNHLFHKLAAEASRLSPKANPIWTLSTDDVQTAVRLMIPGELCKNSVDAGTKAFAAHSASDSASITNDQNLMCILTAGLHASGLPGDTKKS